MYQTLLKDGLLTQNDGIITINKPEPWCSNSQLLMQPLYTFTVPVKDVDKLFMNIPESFKYIELNLYAYFNEIIRLNKSLSTDNNLFKGCFGATGLVGKIIENECCICGTQGGHDLVIVHQLLEFKPKRYSELGDCEMYVALCKQSNTLHNITFAHFPNYYDDYRLFYDNLDINGNYPTTALKLKTAKANYFTIICNLLNWWYKIYELVYNTNDWPSDILYKFGDVLIKFKYNKLGCDSIII